ncbi:MAG: sel1 repeat family protein, partial [Moraxella sp.]|nr:sel1 repeat family protein [Moraxella sp.]
MKLTRTLSAIALACSLAISAPAMADDLDTAVQYFEQQNYPQAFAIFKRLAEQGNADAQFNLGNMYDNGNGVKQDYAQAVRWFRKAA